MGGLGAGDEVGFKAIFGTASLNQARALLRGTAAPAQSEPAETGNDALPAGVLMQVVVENYTLCLAAHESGLIGPAVPVVRSGPR